MYCFLKNIGNNSSNEVSCPVCRMVTNVETDDPVTSLTINHPIQNILNTLLEIYQSRSPSPELTQELIPAFPPPSCGVDYSFSALPPRTPSPIIMTQDIAQNDVSKVFTFNIILLNYEKKSHVVAPIDFPVCQVDEQISSWAEYVELKNQK